MQKRRQEEEMISLPVLVIYQLLLEALRVAKGTGVQESPPPNPHMDCLGWEHGAGGEEQERGSRGGRGVI